MRFIHLPFSVRSVDHCVASLVFMKGSSCCIRGSKIGLAGCGMRLKIKAGCGIRKILGAGYGMTLSWWDRDAGIFAGGMRDL